MLGLAVELSCFFLTSVGYLFISLSVFLTPCLVWLLWVASVCFCISIFFGWCKIQLELIGFGISDTVFAKIIRFANKRKKAIIPTKLVELENDREGERKKQNKTNITSKNWPDVMPIPLLESIWIGIWVFWWLSTLTFSIHFSIVSISLSMICMLTSNPYQYQKYGTQNLFRKFMVHTHYGN